MPKRIILPSIGSRGDIQPYIALASALQNSGFQVTVATHPCMRELVEFILKRQICTLHLLLIRVSLLYNIFVIT